MLCQVFDDIGRRWIGALVHLVSSVVPDDDNGIYSTGTVNTISVNDFWLVEVSHPEETKNGPDEKQVSNRQNFYFFHR